MSVRIKRYSNNGIEQPEWTDTTQEQREVTVDNMTFHFGVNEVKNFLDDGVGIAVGAANPTGSNIVEDRIPYGDAKS